MSDLRIGLVVEGDTDLIIIESALKAILEQSFILTKLQPEATRPKMGSGWSGVLKWCAAVKQRHTASLDSEPTLALFDLLIIHLDADVAREQYANAGNEIESRAAAQGWLPLPCARPCPPVGDTCTALTAVLDSWLAPAQRGNKTIMCLPAQSSGTWLAAAILPDGHALLANLECNPAVENSLSSLPKILRVRKSLPEYRKHSDTIKDKWSRIKTLADQAVLFETHILSATATRENP